MAALPYMQLYVADYLADTTHLTTEEHGAYMLLIMNYWQRGKPLDDRQGRLARVVGATPERWAELAVTLSEFFEVDENSQWKHERIERELSNVKRQQTQRSRAGKASAKARKNAGSERSLNGRSSVVERSLNGRTNEKATNPDTDQNREDTEDTPLPPKGGDLVGPEHPPDLDLEAWERWLQYRQEIRKPLKPASIPAAQRKLAAMGPNQAKAVEESISNGWQGLFAPKDLPAKANGTTGEPEFWS